MNRFERHPVLTAVILIGLLASALLITAEWTLRPAGGSVRDLPAKRFLVMREWLPNTSHTYRTPKARYNDPAGPIDDSYTIAIDAEGFIKPSNRHAKPDFEIAFLGGSTTECLYLRPKERFPARVGELLEARVGLKINVLNAGRSGNHSMHSLVNMIGKVLPRRPRYAVLMHATNDIGWLGGHGTYWMNKKDIALVQRRDRGTTQLLRDLRDRTFPYTFRALTRGWKALKFRLAEAVSRGDPKGIAPSPEAPPRAKTLPAPAPPGPKELDRRRILRENYEPALRSFVAVARAWGIRPVLMTQVLAREGVGGGEGAEGDLLAAEELARGDFDAASFSSIHAYANAIAAHVAQSEGALLIDLAGARDWQPGDVYDGLHLTPTGAKRAAEIIAGAIAADLKAKPAAQGAAGAENK